MYLHIGNNVMLPEKHIIGVFDLEIKDAIEKNVRISPPGGG